MARGRAPGYEGQQEKILSKAAELMARSGYAHTSMNQVAEACGMSKPALYHYFRDKNALLINIVEGHITRLETVTTETIRQDLPPPKLLEQLIEKFVEEYAEARHAHRVLTEDIRFLNEEDQKRVIVRQRQIVRVFSDVIRQIRPDLSEARLASPLAMLLFGMINWMFTWLRPEGEHTYQSMAKVVSQLFLGGLPAVQSPNQRFKSTDKRA